MKPEHLPSHLKNIFSQYSKSETPINESSQPFVYFLIGLESTLSSQDAIEFLASLRLLPVNGSQSELQIIDVPLLPPVSADQASRWSQNFWPVVYKNNNPLGPHPSDVSRAKEEMQDFAGEWMNVAERAAIDVFEARIGEPIGAVVVDRDSRRAPVIVAAAGDARWHGCGENRKNESSNVLAHSVMRAIGLIARKRRAFEKVSQDENKLDTTRFFDDMPLTPTEDNYYSKEMLAAGGYLCLGLDIYVTHEPCVMCSMAILHSRFGRLIFRDRLPRTGGIAVEPSKNVVDISSTSGSLSYGLFWRPELNWKLLAWQWQWHDVHRSGLKLSSQNVHA